MRNRNPLGQAFQVLTFHRVAVHERIRERPIQHGPKILRWDGSLRADGQVATLKWPANGVDKALPSPRTTTHPDVTQEYLWLPRIRPAATDADDVGVKVHVEQRRRCINLRVGVRFHISLDERA